MIEREVVLELEVVDEVRVYIPRKSVSVVEDAIPAGTPMKMDHTL